MNTSSNRPLISYVGCHAADAVSWQTDWDEALRLARQADKPVFFCCGFATCHWCHVLARESFGPGPVASLIMNHSVPLIVDRQERPDLDAFFMTCLQAQGGQGGWPLMGLVTHEGKPFWLSSYLPPRTRGPMTGLYESLMSLFDYWKTDREALELTAKSLVQWVGERPSFSRSVPGGVKELALYCELAAEAEERAAPAFPQVWRLLALHRAGLGASAARIALRMARSPLVDPVGGLFRYATAPGWSVPHYEKSAALTALWALACFELSTFEPALDDFGRASLSWILAELVRDGKLCFGTDADSPGGEGAHYRLPREELDALHLPPDFWNHFSLADEDGLLVARDRLKGFEAPLARLQAARREPLAVDKTVRAYDCALTACAFLLGAEKTGSQDWRRWAEVFYDQAGGCAGPYLDDQAALLWAALRLGRSIEAGLFDLHRRFWLGSSYAAWEDGAGRPPVVLDDAPGGEGPSGGEVMGLLWSLIGPKTTEASDVGQWLRSCWNPTAQLQGELLLR